ncbi:Uncharacterised protein [Cedecea lapagei]|uniref:Uncharacterized protein n=1 Tax=Cedecea lapagei TaxID=158823 RepID=A0A3S4JDK2_9ENTR|nr:hypothetical protein [Cedecea lapagei]VEC00244.1 Uncharacterised protein [Cedecea lapagei]
MDKKLQISIIKTDAGKCFITDCKASSGYHYNYHNSSIEGLIFDGLAAKPTFHKNWYEIPSYPEKIERLITGQKTNRRYELKDADLSSEKYPLIVSYDDRDSIDEDLLHSLYTLKSDDVPDYFQEVECGLDLICEVDNYRDAPEFSYPGIRRVQFSDEKYTISNQNIKHSLIDCIILPEPLRANSACEISSKEMFDLVRQHVKDNIQSGFARITSDYDFCFTVKKIIPLLKPHTYSYQDIFARTKKQRAKLHFKTDTSKEIEIFQMTHDRENYKGYTPIKGFKADNEWELKELIDSFLSTLMETIHSPIEQCSCCNGTGYMQDIK